MRILKENVVLLVSLIVLLVAWALPGWSGQVEKPWSGWRVGIEMGATNTTTSYNDSTYSTGSEFGIAAYVGRDWQFGKTVVGIEFVGGASDENWGYTRWPSPTDPEHGVGTAHYAHAKLRLGRAVSDRLMGYGFIGGGVIKYSSTAVNHTKRTYHSNGATVLAGVGVEYKLREHLIVGAEAGYRRVIVDFSTTNGIDNNGAFATIRTTWRF